RRQVPGDPLDRWDAVRVRPAGAAARGPVSVPGLEDGRPGGGRAADRGAVLPLVPDAVGGRPGHFPGADRPRDAPRAGRHVGGLRPVAPRVAPRAADGPGLGLAGRPDEERLGLRPEPRDGEPGVGGLRAGDARLAVLVGPYGRVTPANPPATGRSG